MPNPLLRSSLRTPTARPALPLAALGFALLVSLVANPAEARGKSLTAPGRYSDWNDEIDRVEILSTFALADYDRVVVLPLTTEGVELPDADDNTYAPVKAVLARARDPFASGLADGLGEAIEITEEAPRVARSLELRVRVERMDPGSQAARYWVGFGAGAAKTALAGELIEMESGKVLLRFEQERRSGVGEFGGDYEELFERNLAQIGDDVAHLLATFLGAEQRRR